MCRGSVQAIGDFQDHVEAIGGQLSKPFMLLDTTKCERLGINDGYEHEDGDFRHQECIICVVNNSCRTRPGPSSKQTYTSHHQPGPYTKTNNSFSAEPGIQAHKPQRPVCLIKSEKSVQPPNDHRSRDQIQVNGPPLALSVCMSLPPAMTATSCPQRRLWRQQSAQTGCP